MGWGLDTEPLHLGNVETQVVVYEAKHAGGKFDAAAPCAVYWMDIEPEYVKANRAKGIMSDRSDLGMMESSMAYGYVGRVFVYSTMVVWCQVPPRHGGG
jgi:hypothetical protein